MKEKWLKFLKENGFLLFLFICVGVVAFSTVYVVTQEIDTKGGELLTKEQMKELPKKFNDKEKAKNNPEAETPKKELAKVETPKENLVLEGDKPSNDKKEDKPTGETVKEEPKKEVKQEPQKQVKDEVKQPVKEEPQKQVKEEIPKELAKNEEAQETFSQGASVKDEKEKDLAAGSSKFLMPVGGNIITSFTSDTLVYSKTLDEWRAHKGIDISAKVGEKVKAPLDGVVKEINKDPLWGTVVILDHGNGLITKFANLGDTNMIKKGLQVKRGDHIAVVGKTADIEMLMEPHLHFEVIKNGELVDPRSIP